MPDPDAPCDVCGGSRFGLVVHNVPYRRPSLRKALAAIDAANGVEAVAA